MQRVTNGWRNKFGKSRLSLKMAGRLIRPSARLWPRRERSFQGVAVNRKSVAWKVFTFAVVGIAYIALVSEGLRNLIAAFALRLHKLPLPSFAVLRNYRWSYRLDLAHLFAMLLMIASWFTWVLVLRVYLAGRVPGGW